MKKQASILAIVLALICMMLPGCSGIQSKEGAGVPESVVLSSDAYYEFMNTYGNCTYEIQHQVDTSAHTDNVTFIMSYESDYAILTESAYLRYQYTKSDDIWTLVDYVYSETPTFELKADSIVNASPWQGEIKNYYSSQPNCSYTLYVEDIDTQNLTITVQYMVDYNNSKYADITTAKTAMFPLSDMSHDNYYLFNIYEEDSAMQFIIDRNGLKGKSH